jgi:hypothetical protein
MDGIMDVRAGFFDFCPGESTGSSVLGPPSADIFHSDFFKVGFRFENQIRKYCRLHFRSLVWRNLNSNEWPLHSNTVLDHRVEERFRCRSQKRRVLCIVLAPFTMLNNVTTVVVINNDQLS